MPKILIIDDESSVLDNLTVILEREGYEVVTATSGEEGLQHFQASSNIDVVITDIRMPGMMGMEVVRAILAVNPDMGVIILTGEGDMDNAVSAMREGAFDYLNKPVSADKLLITLENAIRRLSLLEENRRLQQDIFKKNTYLQGLHDSAQQILMNLIPSDPPPQFRDVKTAAVYKSCDHVGGDMYDMFELGNRVFFYLFDVCSHGILAAVITMIIKSFFDNLKRLQAFVDVTPNLEELINSLNLEMIQNTPSDMYATLFTGYYDRDTQAITYLSSGHIDQYLLHEGLLIPLPSTGTIVGLLDFAEYETCTLPVAPGDKLLLFTDGLTEVWRGDQMIDTEQIITIIEKYGTAPIHVMLPRIYADIMDLAAGKPLEDDLTIVGFAFADSGN